MQSIDMVKSNEDVGGELNMAEEFKLKCSLVIIYLSSFLGTSSFLSWHDSNISIED